MAIKTETDLLKRMHEIGASDLRSTGRFSAQLLASTELLHNETHGDSLAPGPPPPAVSHLRVALYGRVSTKDKGQETENQLAQLREFCKRQEWPIVEEYVDHASGKRSDRVRFLALFADAAQRKFDLVLFWSLDRFSREGVLDTLQHLQKLTAAKVEWKSFTEQYLDSCGVFRDAVLAILATIAKQERVRLSERTQAGIERARAKGVKFGAPKKIFNRAKVMELRSQGKSLRQIARVLKISTATVYRTLTVPAFLSVG